MVGGPGVGVRRIVVTEFGLAADGYLGSRRADGQAPKTSPAGGGGTCQGTRS